MTKIKKIIFASILILISILILCSCEAPISEDIEGDLKTVQNCDGGNIMVDSTTGVMYWMSTTGYNYGTLTLLVNADGTPRIWSGQR